MAGGGEDMIIIKFVAIRSTAVIFQNFIATFYPGRKPIGVTATSELHELGVKKGVRIEFKVIQISIRITNIMTMLMMTINRVMMVKLRCCLVLI